MAKICEVCFGTGKTPAGFCPCADGKLLKVMEQAKEKAEEQEAYEKKLERVKEENAARNKAKKNQEPKDVAPTLANVINASTDWVVISQMRTNRGVVRNIRGYVIAADYSRDKLLVQTVGLNKQYGVADGEGWVHVNEVKFLPPEIKTVDIESMIDLALMLNDKPWFDELMEKECTR